MDYNLISDVFNSVFSRRSAYLTWRMGATNVVLSAPHGGSIKPLNFPSRKSGNRSKDTYTRRLIQKVISLMQQDDSPPFYVYSNIHRSRVDLNRDLDEACQGNPDAEYVWYKWNAVLDSYCSTVRELYGKGLYIDLHSHNNSNLFEIGYGLSVKDYLALMNGKKVTALSTLSPLTTDSDYQNELLFGYGSFPQSLESAGFDVLVPYSDRYYLNGGRNIKKFGSNRVGALQIECPISVLKANLDGVAQTIVNSIALFQSEFM